MNQQKSGRIKKTIAVLMVIFFVISLTAVSASAAYRSGDSRGSDQGDRDRVHDHGDRDRVRDHGDNRVRDWDHGDDWDRGGGWKGCGRWNNWCHGCGWWNNWCRWGHGGDRGW